MARTCFVIFVILVFTSTAHAIAPAGAKLELESTVDVHGERYVDKTTVIGVPQIFGLNFSTSEINAIIPPGHPSYFPCRIENLGNGTDRLLIDLDHAASDFDIRLVVDENSDGEHQDYETRTLSDSLVIGEGGSQHFLIEIIPPKNARKGQWFWATLTAVSSISDGAGYVGYNGLNYGGKDRVSMMISVVVE